MPPKSKTETSIAEEQEPLSQTLPTNHKNATNALLATLAELETMLAPLFATPSALNETMAKLETDKRCQIELLMAYAINTLAYINLKTNGIAPSSHPVVNELKRIKTYTEKLRHAIQGYKSTMGVDKDAAARFIRGALAANESAARKTTETGSRESEVHQRSSDDEGSLSRPSKAQKLGKSSSSSATAVAPSQSSSSSTSAPQASTRKRTMDPFQGLHGVPKKTRS
ncbi:hypothetical protein BGZ65_002689 [Modicella reniformis]|uniref:Exosome complex protein n=1 Tax=Modicella reniformis TaxID=1440133 RepID=A0A9P6J3M4_9FUNG|nr:hypothetical protein BGZ65_002689 [Modicella reniformis]